MRAQYPFLSFLTLTTLLGGTFPAAAQSTLILNPNKSTVIGYHDNFNSANTNYSTALHWSAIAQPGTSGGVNKARSLMSFDLTAIPTDATVLGAFLSLSASGPIGAGDVAQIGSMGANSAALYRINTPWVETSVTWNTQPSFTTMNAVPLAQSTYTMQNYLNIDVTTLVQDMVANPTNSYGFMIKLDNETPTRGLCFKSKMVSEQDKRPQLVVVYGDCKVGIREIEEAYNGLSISPNVASPGNTVRLEMGGTKASHADLVLLNSLGQVVYTRRMESWPQSITVPALAQGSYTWRVQDASGQVLGLARMMVQ